MKKGFVKSLAITFSLLFIVSGATCTEVRADYIPENYDELCSYNSYEPDYDLRMEQIAIFQRAGKAAGEAENAERKAYPTYAEAFPDVDWDLYDSICNTYEEQSKMTKKNYAGIDFMSGKCSTFYSQWLHGGKAYKLYIVGYITHAITTFEEAQILGISSVWHYTRTVESYSDITDSNGNPIVFNLDYNEDAPLKAWGYQQMVDNGFIYQPGAIKVMKIKGYVDGVIDYSVVYQKWNELGITEDDIYYGLADPYFVNIMDNIIETEQNDLKYY